MSKCYHRFWVVSATTIACLIAAAGVGAQEEGDDPFAQPLQVDAANPFDNGENLFGDAAETPPATRPAPAHDAAPAGSQQSTPVFWAESRPEQSERIQQVLREPLNTLGLEFQGAPLAEVVNFLRDDYNIEVQIDAAALDDLGISTDEHISVNLRNISLGAALRIMLRPLELTYVISDEVLLITTEEEALTRLQVAVYPVGDVLAVKAGYEKDPTTDNELRRPEDIDALTDLIVSTVASDTWVVNGGPEAEIRTMQPGLLVVSQTQDVHEQISQLLTALRMAKQHTSAVPHRGMSHQERRDKEEARRRANTETEQGGGGAF